jgi:hypothetical protein
VNLRLHAPAALAAASLLLAGCGNDPLPTGDQAALGRPGQTKRFVAGGGAVSFRYPVSWIPQRGAPPRLAQLGSGSALVAVYAYPRTDLGTDPGAIEASRRRLLASLHRRDPGFLVKGSTLTRVDGAPAVQVAGRGLIGGAPTVTRATHVYKPRVEWVIDAYATPDRFAAANRIAFAPLLASIRLANRVRGRG